MSKVETDRGVCKFFIEEKCKRGDNCQWVHTTKQCDVENCDVYTDKKLCFKCNKKSRVAKKAEYERKLKSEGYPCAWNIDRVTKKKGSCNNLTLRGDFCNDCFEIAKTRIVGPCRNKQCNNRVMGARGFCTSCERR